MIEFKHKDKIRAEDYITGFLIIGFLIFAVFYTLESLMSLLVYPLIALFFRGIVSIKVGTAKINKGNPKNLNKVLLGIISIGFSVAILDFFVKLPEITPQILITLAVYPIFITGLASIVKGLIINIYSRKHRYINIFIGIITIMFCMFALFSYQIFYPNSYLFHFVSLSILLIINILSRAALYLSEFNLSLFHKKNYKLFFYIISDYLIYVNKKGDIVLTKT
ncbi:MAG: hypothetical protein ACW98D_06755 [Promethearchaeota archaeon]|jgi:hypothetical protein